MKNCTHRWVTYALSLSLVSLGCGGGSDDPAADLGPGAPDGGGGDVGTTPTDLGMGTTGCADLPATSVNAGGVRSAYPNIQYSAGTGYRIDSVGVKVTEDGDSRGPLFEMFIEVTNTGATIGCSYLPDVSLDFEELLGTVDGDGYYNDFGSLYSCIAPGQSGILTALERGLDRSDLEAASSLTITMNPFALGTYTRETDGPTFTQEDVVSDADGYGVAGRLSINTTIYNYGVSVYPRDSRGVFVDELLAYPGELGTLSAGSTIDFDTTRTPCAFSSYRTIDGWIRPSNTLRAAGVATPEAQARDEGIAARRAQVAALRATDAP
ncbi:MAG: hypothetical protein R3B40_13585 [Polyangiales bacterium]|nr:hypothetical protein [Myxococcales bacterium]MCB9659862.1 hypothetical protein [Sandaracinaceae bacterium]